MQTHIVPVGFDYDRLIAPLVRDQLDVDRVVLLEGAVGSEANVEYSQNLSEKLEQDFQNLLGAETDRFVLEDVYDYDAAFEEAFAMINDELDRGNEVWVNISAMPRPGPVPTIRPAEAARRPFGINRGLKTTSASTPAVRYAAM